ncbi:MAG: acyltransferase family protein [Cyanophyceae cyanobacterium]
MATLPSYSAPTPTPSASNSFKRVRELDGIRGLTAAYVVFHNWAGSSTTLPIWLQKGLLSFGQEAVMVFFLLSGFVMYWSLVNRPKQNFYQYFIRRFRRIYFPFLCAILLVFGIAVSKGGLMSTLGNPDFWPTLVGNLLMTQELSIIKPGIHVEPFLGNLPFWTLTYEWWFYFLFFPVYCFFLKKPWRLYIVTLYSLTNFLIYTQTPNIVSLVCSYFILWWSGLELATFVHRKSLSWKSLSPTLFSVAGMAMVTLIPVFFVEKIALGYYPFVIFRHFFAVLIFLIIAKVWYGQRSRLIHHCLIPFGKISPISYALYLFHYPILVLWNPAILSENLWISVPVKFIVLISLSYLVEVYLQPKINKVIR